MHPEKCPQPTEGTRKGGKKTRVPARSQGWEPILPGSDLSHLRWYLGEEEIQVEAGIFRRSRVSMAPSREVLPTALPLCGVHQ